MRLASDLGRPRCLLFLRPVAPVEGGAGLSAVVLELGLVDVAHGVDTEMCSFTGGSLSIG